jgi:hypothetical protein
MRISRKALTKILIFSLTVILYFVIPFNYSHTETLTAFEDTFYFEPVLGVKMSPDEDTFYVNPGDDVKINLNLRNVRYIAAFGTGVLMDYCYDGNIFLDPAKNNGSANPKCYEGSRVEYWGVTSINLDLYPQVLISATTMMANPLPPGDGPVATLTFTATDRGCIFLDTFYTPVWMPPYVVDSLAVGYTVELIRKNFYLELCPYNPGDLNWDDIVDILDVPHIVYYLFRDWDAPCPIKAADANCDQEVTIADAVYLINYIFRSGSAPQICDY